MKTGLKNNRSSKHKKIFSMTKMFPTIRIYRSATNQQLKSWTAGNRKTAEEAQAELARRSKKHPSTEEE